MPLRIKSEVLSSSGGLSPSTYSSAPWSFTSEPDSGDGRTQSVAVAVENPRSSRMQPRGS